MISIYLWRFLALSLVERKDGHLDLGAGLGADDGTLPERNPRASESIGGRKTSNKHGEVYHGLREHIRMRG